MRSNIRIIIADDHEMVLRGLVGGFETTNDIKVVGFSLNGQQVLDQYEEIHPDVVLLDYRMPQLDGLQTLEKLIDLDPHARVIILSSYNGENEIYRSTVNGARGYLTKNCQLPELCDAIRAVASGHKHFPKAILEKLELQKGRDPLTKRELDVLRLLADGLSNREMSEALFVSEATVKTHIARVLTKLGAKDRTGALVTAVKRGLVTLDSTTS